MFTCGQKALHFGADLLIAVTLKVQISIPFRRVHGDGAFINTPYSTELFRSHGVVIHTA
jgi:hypothetical protein